MQGYYENTGGLSALPRRTVLGGEEHLLSYITPEEAQMLREEGGGVTPTGGQYRGPGGLPAFWTGTPGSEGGGGHGGYGGGMGGGVGPTGHGLGTDAPQASNTGDSPFGVAQAIGHAAVAEAEGLGHDAPQSSFDTPKADLGQSIPHNRALFASELADKKAALSKAAIAANQANKAKQQQALANLSKARAKAKALGFVPGLASQANVAANQGIYSGLGMYGQVLSPSQVMSLPTAAFSNPAVANALGLGQVGDPNSVFGLAVQGLSKGLFGLLGPPAITQPYGLASLFGDVTGLFDLPSIGDMALLGMVRDIGEKAIGDIDFSLDVSLGDLIGKETAKDVNEAISDVSQFGEDVYGFFASDIPKAIEAVAEDAWSDSVLQAAHDSLFSGEDAPFSSTGHVAQFGKELGEIPGEVGEAIGEGLSSVADALGLSDAAGFVGETAGTVGEAIGDAFSGTPSLATVGQQGGGPGIPQGFEPGPEYIPPKPYVNPYFKDYPEGEPYKKKGPITMEELRDRYVGSLDETQKYPEGYSMEDILEQYVSKPETNYPVFAHSGGGVQNLIDDQKKNYSISNQDTINTAGTAFSRKPFSATPHEDLTNGSHSYVSNVLNGHSVPVGMTNVQQMQKPMEAFPTGGQMNYDHNLQADYSRPQSFYSMPNMNKVA